MRLWDYIEKEAAHIHDALHAGDLSERVWDCEPLLVIDESDSSVAFHENTNVDVTPNADGTLDLVAEKTRDGWHPSLVNAIQGDMVAFGEVIRGLRCQGSDRDGNRFTWYINAAADGYLESRKEAADTVPKAEHPE